MSRDSKVCVLLACFAGAKRASKVRGQMGKAIRADGGSILDEVVLVVGAARKARVYDPRRTLAGALTPALTWGLFGLLVGGLQGLGVWGVLGAICGGGYAYLTEHLLTKDELKQIGERLPADSSAIAVFVQGSDPERMLSSVSSLQADDGQHRRDRSGSLRRGLRRWSHRVETSGATGDATSPGETTVLRMCSCASRGSMVLDRRSELRAPPKRPDPREPQVEIVIQANEEGRRRVVDPSHGHGRHVEERRRQLGRLRSRLRRDRRLRRRRGALGAVDSGLIVGISWAIFGLVAGALYGLVGGTSHLGEEAQEDRCLRGSRHVARGRVGGRDGDAGCDRAVDSVRIGALGPAIQPRRTRVPSGGVRRLTTVQLFNTVREGDRRRLFTTVCT